MLEIFIYNDSYSYFLELICRLLLFINYYCYYFLLITMYIWFLFISTYLLSYVWWLKRVKYCCTPIMLFILNKNTWRTLFKTLLIGNAQNISKDEEKLSKKISICYKWEQWRLNANSSLLKEEWNDEEKLIFCLTIPKFSNSYLLDHQFLELFHALFFFFCLWLTNFFLLKLIIVITGPVCNYKSNLINKALSR